MFLTAPGSPIRCVLNLRRPGDRVGVTEKTGRRRGRARGGGEGPGRRYLRNKGPLSMTGQGVGESGYT